MSNSTNTLTNGNFFSGNINSTDSIGEIISQIFGPGWAEIGTEAIFGGGSESASMIIAILGALNVVVLNAGAICLGWLALQASVGTAHEGQFLGKRFHSYWAPIRFGVLVTFLAPVAKGGLCVFQVLGLILIGCSIQFGNFIKSTGLDYMLENGGRVSTLQVPAALEENTQKLASGLLKTLVVQYHYNVNKNQDFEFYKIKEDPHYTFEFYSPYTNLKGEPMVLAYAQIPDYETSSEIAVARANAVNQMYATLSNLAYSIVTRMTAEEDNVPAEVELFEQSIDDYIAAVSPHIEELISKHNPDYMNELEEFVALSKENGVLWLGSYYHTISRYSSKINDIAADYPSLNSVGMYKMPDDVNILLEAALASVQTIEDDLKQKTQIARKNSGSGMFKGPLNDITYSLTSIPMNGLILSIAEGDPLANLADWGHNLMGTSEAIMVAYMGLYGAAEFGKGASQSIAGKVLGLFTIGASDGAISAGTGILSKLWAVVLFLIIPLITLGIMLGIYIPLVPYIIWMSAIVGCIIQWIEFLVLGSIWCITFASGEGEGIAGQRSQQGLTLIANAVLRLPLMVVGFMMAVVLMPLIGKVIAATYIVAVGGMTAEHVVGIPTMIAVWFIFGSFMILETHTVYGLTTYIPDNAMKFFGGAITSMGEAAHEGRTRSVIMASLTKGEGAGQMVLGKSGAEPSEIAGTGDSNNTNQKASQLGASGDSMDMGERDI